uniref:Uncharacterized protein n=1 Tax=Caenorhabditis japonica TaxID=281687 RepID=A0A8R1IUH1_CAEJA
MDEHQSGMEMMLSSMVSPTDDDLPWQFQFEDPPFLKENENDSLDSAAQSPSSSLFDDFDDSSSSSLSSPSFTSFSDSGTSSLSSFDMMMSMFPDPTNPTVSEETRMPPPPAPVRKNVVGEEVNSKFMRIFRHFQCEDVRVSALWCVGYSELCSLRNIVLCR